MAVTMISRAAEMPIKFHSDCKGLSPNLTTSRHDTSRDHSPSAVIYHIYHHILKSYRGRYECVFRRITMAYKHVTHICSYSPSAQLLTWHRTRELYLELIVTWRGNWYENITFSFVASPITCNSILFSAGCLDQQKQNHRCSALLVHGESTGDRRVPLKNRK